MKINQSKRARQKGNALIEFALYSFVLLLMACGTIDFARALTTANIAAAAAAAGTKYGALSPAHWSDAVGIQNAALADTGNMSGVTATATQFCACNVGGSAVSCPASCGSANPETYVQVVVSVPYYSMIAYPWLPDPVHVSQTSIIRVQ
jgi:Flp pilus assembly protein TadG